MEDRKENVKCSSKCQLCCPHQDTTNTGKAMSLQTASNTTQLSQKYLGPGVGSVELRSLGWACWASSASVPALFATWRSKPRAQNPHCWWYWRTFSQSCAKWSSASSAMNQTRQEAALHTVIAFMSFRRQNKLLYSWHKHYADRTHWLNLVRHICDIQN